MKNKGIENLKPFKKGDPRAKATQLLSAKKKHENSVNRNFAIDMMRSYLLRKKTVTERDAATIGEDTELKVGKRTTRVEVLFAKVLASLESRTERGDRLVERDFAEILKACGMHFEQSSEALGGAENPINYTEHIGKPSPEYMEEINRQAIELGVYADTDEDDNADSGND